jgi:hypothetical protein
MLDITRSFVGNTMYNDLYVRDDLGGTGLYPSTVNPCQSPDIIPLQSGTITWATANSTYGSDQGKSIVNNGVNNVYVRAKNLNNVPGAGTASLYYADASLFLLPTTWNQITAANGTGALSFVDGTGNTNIAAGTIGLSNPSFMLAGMPPGPHYCLITVVQTAAHPVTIPTTFSSNAAFVQWVQNNPAVGWRNISYQANGSIQMTRTYTFASTNSTSAYFHFRVVGKGFATNTAIAAQCTDQACPINQSMTLPAPDSQGNQITGFDTYIPAGFSGTLVMTATSPSGPFPANANLTMSYYQYPSMSNELDMSVAGLFKIARHTEAGPVHYAPMLIKIGECTIQLA